MKSHLNLRNYFVVVVWVVVLGLAGLTEGTTYYVSPGQSIQSAINGADDYDEIEVAPGTYPETINFLGLKIRLYSSGGPEVTTINGGGALHVVLCRFGEDANTTLEGFTITGGNANGTDYSGQGGGMLNRDASSPTVINCIFSGNSAVYGGGMCNTDGSNPIVTDCTFTGNSATNTGGGMCNTDSSSPTVTHCTFSINTASNGGGIYSFGGNPTVVDCTFTENSVSQAGGGMYNYYSTQTIIRCTFTGNTATVDGGGIYNYGGSSIITDCAFSGNGADYGGGMYNTYSASPTVTNCVFLNNTASGTMGGGGGMLNQTSATPTLINCVFSRNNTYAISNLGYGGASQATVTNCILWDDTPSEIYNYDGSATVTYSDVQGGYTGTGNINAAPLFLDAAGGDFRFISSGSPCVDTGNNSVVTEPNDLAGNPRIVDGDLDSIAVVDMGAYELQPKQIHNITQDSWYERIQTAIDDADNGDQIEVGPDTYYEAIDFKGKGVRLYSSGGPEVATIDASGLNTSVVTCTSEESQNTILEGFTITGGTGTTVSSLTYGGGMYINVGNPTITNCIFTGNSVSGEGGGMYIYNSIPIITNCTFTGNTANRHGGGICNYSSSSPILTNCTFSQNTAETYGGGMINSVNCSPTVTGCIFSDNTADEGGGMLNNNSNPIVANCTFSDNTVIVNGGGMHSYNSSPTVMDCNFIGNVATGAGGGMFTKEGSANIINCTFEANTAGGDGGGMMVEGYGVTTNPTVTNCLFIDNTAGDDGGGMVIAYDVPTVTNCTFSGNSAASNGGAIRNYAQNPTVTNCIFWGNSPDEISNGGGGVSNVTYSDVQGGYTGTGNINMDPNFVDANNPDPNLINLRLLPDSPCIDAADTTAVPAGIFVDLDGNPRGVDDPQTPNTGVSVLGITVDMGAYEFQPCPTLGDINCDGVVNFKDMAILAANWLVGAE